MRTDVVVHGFAQLSPPTPPPLPPTPILIDKQVARYQTNSRVRHRGLAMSTEGGELEEAMGQLESSSKNAILPPVATRGEGGGVLNDVTSEVARRSAKHDEDDDEDIVPMNAGIEPMAPGPIVANPIQGMDGEKLELKKTDDDCVLC